MVHIVNVIEIMKTLKILEENIQTIDTSNRQILLQIVQSIHGKRGLINIFGTAQKWLYESLDGNDRTEIMEHISTIEGNNRNIIRTINNQIINDSFNKSLINLKNSIEEDRNNIKSAFEQVRNNNNEIVKEYLYLGQFSELNLLEDKIKKIQDKLHVQKIIFLTLIYLQKQKSKPLILIYKLKLLKIGVMTFKDSSFVIAIQITDKFIITQLMLLTAVPNSNNMEIDEPNENIIEINNVILHCKENVAFKELQKSNHWSVS